LEVGRFPFAARRMAKDVDAALRRIIQQQGGKSEEQTNEHVEKLKSDMMTC
jgi:sulfite reductase alpha subunit-like flavoprotein